MLRNKSLHGVLAVAAAVLFGIIVTSCGKDDNPTGGSTSNLNGTWIAKDAEEYEMGPHIMILNNGSFEVKAPFFDDETYSGAYRGTYSTSGSSINLTIKEINGDFFNMIFGFMFIFDDEITPSMPSEYYNKSEMKIAWANMWIAYFYDMFESMGIDTNELPEGQLADMLEEAMEGFDEMTDYIFAPLSGSYVLKGDSLSLTLNGDTTDYTKATGSLPKASKTSAANLNKSTALKIQNNLSNVKKSLSLIKK